MWKFRFTGVLANNSQDIIDNTGKFVGSGGIDVSNRITMRTDGNGFSIRNSSGSKEWISYMGSSNCGIGTYTATTFDVFTQNSCTNPQFQFGNDNCLYVNSYRSGYSGGGMAVSWFDSNATALSHLGIWNGTANLSIWANNGILSYSGLILATSDRRVKENIVYHDDDDKQRIISGLRNLKTCQFNYKKDKTQKCYGIIAQEALANGLHELCYLMDNEKLTVEDERYDVDKAQWCVNYQLIGLALIPYVQRLEKELEEQKAECASLMRRIEGLEQALYNDRS